ncbi:RNA ligase/cyclic nucleotide phosphodiesterase [Xylaria arbuscula]|nr:RNA ligase/cyclic nucleotide phosphodiesterase [Xylaria arbuscula]
MGSVLESTDIKNKLEDLSGVVVKPGENPYNALIEVCRGDPTEIQSLYAAHRLRRNAQQKQKFLDTNFKELVIDPYLLRLENPHIEPGFKDTRHCMTFWGRPPIHILELAGVIQKKLKDVAPGIWLMPPHRMHITTLELAFCRTSQEIDDLKETVKPIIPSVASYTYQHRARLVKPMISYDLSAFAVSFLPAAGETEVSPAPIPPDNAVVLEKGDSYSYHHLRRDMWNQAKAAGVTIESRYIVPSAHITLGRYLSHDDHATPEQRKKWVDAIDNINEWLEREVWECANSEVIGEWIVGQEKGLDIRVGNLWVSISLQFCQEQSRRELCFLIMPNTNL